MANSAKVDSIEVLRAFKIAMIKFAEASKVALGDAESEMQRTMVWLETEQPTYWSSQVRKRTEAVAKAKEALRAKKIFKDSSGRQQSAVEEEKILRIAMSRLEEAEQKLATVKKYYPRLQKEIESYKGSVQRFMTTIETDIPMAGHQLEQMVVSLEGYVGLAAPSVAGSTEAAVSGIEGAAAGEGQGSMARAEPSETTEPKSEAPADSADKKSEQDEQAEQKASAPEQSQQTP